MTCVEFKNHLCIHPSGDSIYWVDFTDDPKLYADTLTGTPVVTCSDATVTITVPTVLSINTVVPYRGTTRTITANKGISFRMTGGTAIAADAEPARITVLCDTAGGYKVDGVGLLRVEA